MTNTTQTTVSRDRRMLTGDHSELSISEAYNYCIHYKEESVASVDFFSIVDIYFIHNFINAMI